MDLPQFDYYLPNKTYFLDASSIRQLNKDAISMYSQVFIMNIVLKKLNKYLRT